MTSQTIRVRGHVAWRSTRLLLALVASAVLTTAAGCAERKPRPDQSVPVRRPSLEARVIQQWEFEGVVSEAVFSPESQRLIVVVAKADATQSRPRWGETQLILLSMEGTSRLLAEGENFVRPAWHPDGARVAFVQTTSADRYGRHPSVELSNTVTILDLSTGGLAIPAQPDGGKSRPQFSPHGDEVAYQIMVGKILAADAPLGSGLGISDLRAQQARTILLEEGDYAPGPGLAWSPSGDRLAMVYSHIGEEPEAVVTSELWTYDLRASSWTKLAAADTARYSVYLPRFTADGGTVFYTSNQWPLSATAQLVHVDTESRQQSAPLELKASAGHVLSPAFAAPDGCGIAATEMVETPEGGFRGIGIVLRRGTEIGYVSLPENCNDVRLIAWSQAGDRLAVKCNDGKRLMLLQPIAGNSDAHTAP